MHPLIKSGWGRLRALPSSWPVGRDPPGQVTPHNVRMNTKTATSEPHTQAQLSVRNGRAAIDFHKAAFRALEVFPFGGADGLEEVLPQLAVGGARVWVEDEPPHARQLQ